jgi:hypothetical protein
MTTALLNHLFIRFLLGDSCGLGVKGFLSSLRCLGFSLPWAANLENDGVASGRTANLVMFRHSGLSA